MLRTGKRSDSKGLVAIPSAGRPPLLNKDSQPLLLVFPSRTSPLPLPPYYVLHCLRALWYREVTTASAGHRGREVGTSACISLGALSQPPAAVPEALGGTAASRAHLPQARRAFRVLCVFIQCALTALRGRSDCDPLYRGSRGPESVCGVELGVRA